MAGVVTIPATWNGKPVTAIASDAFYNCARMTSLTIPASIKTIGMYAFCGCKALTSLSLPAGITSMDYHSTPSSPTLDPGQ